MRPHLGWWRAWEARPDLPAGPDGVDIRALGDINNQLDVGVVVVVGAAGDLDVVVGHADVVGVGLQVLGRGYDGEVDGALVAERLVRPLADGADLLDGGDAVVGNQDLRSEEHFALATSLFPSVFPPPGHTTHIGNHGVAVVLGDKVLDLGRGRVLEPVAADEVVGDVELLCIGLVAVGEAVPVVAMGGGPAAVGLGHDCVRQEDVKGGGGGGEGGGGSRSVVVVEDGGPGWVVDRREREAAGHGDLSTRNGCRERREHADGREGEGREVGAALYRVMMWERERLGG